MDATTTNVRIIAYPNNWVMRSPRHPDAVLEIPRDGRWALSGTSEYPTISPSMDEQTGGPGQTHEDMAKTGPKNRDHYTVTNGAVFYHNNSTHILAGQSRPLPYFTRVQLVYAKARGATFDGSENY